MSETARLRLRKLRMAAREAAWADTQVAAFQGDIETSSALRARWLRLSAPELQLAWRVYQKTILEHELELGYSKAVGAAGDKTTQALIASGLTEEDAWRVLSTVVTHNADFRGLWYGLYYFDGVQQRARGIVAAVGSDGKREVVWGLGTSATEACTDAKTHEGVPELLRYVDVPPSKVEQIEAGNVDAESLGLLDQRG